MSKIILIFLCLLINFYFYSQDDKGSVPIEVDSGESDIVFFDTSKTGKIFSGAISGLTFSQDGRYVIGYSVTGELKIYDIYDKSCIFSIQINSEIFSARISKDNRFIFIISQDNFFRIIRVEDSALVYKEAYSSVPASLEMTSDGRYAAAGADAARVYQYAGDSKWLKVFESKKIEGMFVSSLCFSGDSELLITAVNSNEKSDKNNFIEICEYKKGKYVTNRFFKDQYLPWISKIEITPDSKIIFAALSDNTIKGFERIRTRINPMNIFDSGSSFKNELRKIEISDSGKYLAGFSSDNAVKVFDIKKNKAVFDSKASFKSTVYDIGFSANDKYFAVSFENHNVAVYNLPAGTLFMEVLSGDKSKGGTEPAFFDYSPGNKYIAKNSENGIIKVLKLVKFYSQKNSSVSISDEALSQIKAIFNKHFGGIKEGDIIFFYQKDISPKGVPVYHVRIKLKNGNVMLVRTTAAFDEYKFLFDAVNFENNNKLSVNIILAESMSELDKGQTIKGDWNSIAGKLLKPDSKEVNIIKNR